MDALQKSAQNQLKQFVEQIERLTEDKKSVTEDIRDKFLEAKSAGFDTKVMKAIIKLRSKTKMENQEFESLLDVYKHALGMVNSEEYIEE